MKRLVGLLVVAINFLLLCNIADAQMQWITGYYPDWWYNLLRPGVKWNGDNTGATGKAEKSMLDYSLLTHIVVFSGDGTDDVAPYCAYVTGKLDAYGKTDSADIECGQATGSPAPYLRTLIDSAHAKGVKVVISMGGIYGEGQQQMSAIAADPVKTEAFVVACCAYAKRKGADGIEINWEFPYQADQAGHNRLIRRFRKELDTWNPKGLFIGTAYARTDECEVGGHLQDGTCFGYVRDSILLAFDQINIETYTMWQGNDQDYRAGFNTPIDIPTQFPNYNGYSLNDAVKGDGLGSVGTWQAAGYPISKLGMSLSLETSVFTGASAMGQKYTGYNFGDYRKVPPIPSKTFWDSTAASPYYSSNDTIITFEDPESIAKKIEWAKSKGFGGVMLYQLGSAFLPNDPNDTRKSSASCPADQLLRAVRQSVGPLVTAIASQPGSASPAHYNLGQNYPNPFNPSTIIPFAIPQSSHVIIKIYDVMGREVATLEDRFMNAGKYSVTFNASAHNGTSNSALASGVYFYRLTAGTYTETKKLLLLR
jgi:hypothetical protein